MENLIEGISNLNVSQECGKSVKSKQRCCIYPGCEKQPSFNMKGQPRPSHCGGHKEPEMVDVVTKKCTVEGCDKRASYNFKGKNTSEYCNDHKKTNMINIKKKCCIHEECLVSATFNFKGKTEVLYCDEHKKPRMINIKAKICIHEDCTKQASFNVENKKEVLYCSDHKLPNMIDVKSKKCLFKGCKKHPVYNFKGLKIKLYCNDHKLPGMIDIKNRRCIYPDCEKQCNFNFRGKPTAEYCSDHKKPDMIDINSRRCKTYLCDTLIRKNYEGYCIKCFARIYPDRPNSRNYKTKETAAVAHIKTHFPDFDWILDKRVLDGCSHRRPDAIMDLGYQLIIVEVDENQHSSYDCSCENKRLMEISKDVGHRPIIFIRFNPDKYLIGSVKVKSCWGLDGHGMCVVKDKTEWNKRLDMLNQQIRYWTENSTHKTLEIIELFYDLEK